MRIRRWAALVSAVAALVAGAGAASADEKALFQQRVARGEHLYQISDYPAALVEFKSAYRLYPRPDLLFNIARCYEVMAKLREAIDYYERYLREKQEPGDRRLVAARIATLRARLARDSKRADGPVGRKADVGRRDPAATELAASIGDSSRAELRRSKTHWAYASLGTGAAFLTTSGALYGVGLSQRATALDSYHAANAPGQQAQMDAHWADVESGQTKITAGHVFLGLGVAALGLCLYELVTRPSSAPEQRLSVGLLGEAAVVLSGRY